MQNNNLNRPRVIDSWKPSFKKDSKPQRDCMLTEEERKEWTSKNAIIVSDERSSEYEKYHFHAGEK